MVTTRMPPDHGEGCWHRIGVSGDRSCPELAMFVHCRNCPAFTASARTFFDRQAPEGTWRSGRTCWPTAVPRRPSASRVVGKMTRTTPFAARRGEPPDLPPGGRVAGVRTRAVAEVTTPRPVHRIPHRTGRVLAGLVYLQGQAQLCVSLHGLLGIDPHGPTPRLVVLRDPPTRRDLGLQRPTRSRGVQRVPRSHAACPVPSTLANPTVGFSRAVSPGMGGASASWTSSGSSPPCGSLGRERRPQRILDDGAVPHGGGGAHRHALRGPGGAGGRLAAGREQSSP